MSDSQNNLIIGLISGYNFTQLRPFFDSLASTGYRGKVLLYYSQIAPETIAELEQRDVWLVPFNKWVFKHPWKGYRLDGEGKLGELIAGIQRLLQKLPGKETTLRALGRRLYHVVNIRFLLTNELLQRGELNRFDRLMLTDVRDVVFQRDPFASFDDGGKVWTFLEHPRFTMTTDANYRDWITKAFGDNFAKPRLQERLSCCAITIGPREAMANYFATFVKLLLENTTPEPFRFGLDSAIHNRIIWEKLVSALNVAENLNGPVVHLGGLKAEEIIRGNSGELLNADGSQIAVIHQYDRHADISEYFGGQVKKKRANG